MFILENSCHSIKWDEMKLILHCFFFFFITVSLDYTPPTDTYVIEAGEERDCLQLMILDDSIFEGSEDLTGSLEGIVNELGQLIRNPERITLDPAMTTIQINDNDGIQ